MDPFGSRLVTEEEYLRSERAADDKSELLDGRMYAMAGGSPRHDAIAANVTIAIGSRIKGQRCVLRDRLETCA